MSTTRMIDFSFHSDGTVFDLIDKTDRSAPLLITDYHRLDREIIIDKTTRSAKLGGQKPHKAVTSISELRNIFDLLITRVQQIVTSSNNGIVWLGSTIGDGREMEMNLFPEPVHLAFDLSISSLEKNLLINQLIFDILFDKYIHESQLMTRNGYSTYLAEKLYSDAKDSYRHSINQRLTRGMAVFHDKADRSTFRTQLEMLGVAPNKYVQYYTPHARKNPSRKKPKFIWDQLYYNFGLQLSYRQYRRQLTRDNRDYPYEMIINDLKSYNDFVIKLLPVENESFEKYFRMSMDYYVLESYKRVDFMFKLISALPQISLGKISKEHYLVKRFHPLVLTPYQENNELRFTTEHNYYRPLFQAEDALYKQKIHSFDYSYILGVKLQKYQIIRAKAYELFKYHYVFDSNDYVEIKRFLCECYDMRTYHQSNTFWGFIQDSDWKKIDNKTKQQLKDQIQSFLSINDAFFWRSSNRDYTKPKADN